MLPCSLQHNQKRKKRKVTIARCCRLLRYNRKKNKMMIVVIVTFFASTKWKKKVTIAIAITLFVVTKRKKEKRWRQLLSSLSLLQHNQKRREGTYLQVLPSSDDSASHFKHSRALTMVAPTSGSEDGVNTKWGEIGRRGEVGEREVGGKNFGA